MKYDRKTYFTENGDPTVPGFTIIERGNNQYRIAEKWHRSDGSTWITYWIDADDLHDRVKRGSCEVKGMVSDSQFEAVCNNVDRRALA